jgi:arabinofuranan 3-O-arabinosyltransferase
VLAAVSYIPLLRTAPGMVEDDSKQYLYTDPVHFMSQIVSMWDPDVSMGTVTHQYIGYLLPMGPYYALMEALGVPTWVAQRLWTGSLLFLAGAGVLFLLRTLSPAAGPRGTGPRGAISLDTATIGGVGAMVAALAYMLSPYVLQNEARQSALLLPWVGLPWMVGLTARALRQGGWRHCALFAVVVALVGSTNAVALILVGVGPVLFVVWELAAGHVPWRRALAVALKIGVLSAAVSLWWAAGLSIEAGYGMDILRYTESIPTVSRTSLASETLRGLGYWFFYGVDKLGLYLPMAAPYMTSLWLLAVSFAVPVVAFVAAFVLRWRERSYFILLVVVGTILSVGAHPLSDPSPLGSLVKTAATGSTVGAALRSTNRATPLVVLGTAVLLGAGVAALLRRWRVAGAIAAVAAVGLVAADIPALWEGQFVAANLSRPEKIPSYWSQAAKYLDDQPDADQTRAMVEPGIDFSTYRWGTTLEPVLPGLMTRPEVDRGLVPYGSPGSADLLDTFDDDIQDDTLNPSAVAPMLRLMSAGDLVLQSDLAYEHYNTPRPRALWQKFDPPPPGLGAPVGFGSPSVTAEPPVKYPLIDETELGLPHSAPYPQPVEVFSVAGARPILRTEGATTPLLLDGDGAGLIAAAGAGLLDGQATVLYSPSFVTQPGVIKSELAAGADLVVTDTNRRQAEQFGTVGDNFGYTETAGEKPLVPDDRDARLPLFPSTPGDTSQTVAEQQGVKSVQASNYGNPITYVPEDRPDQALDGNLRTTWTVAAFDDPVGQFLRVALDQPLTTDHINLVQPLYGPRNRWITRATLRFDGGHAVTVKLGPSSRTATGQTVTFPTRTFSTLKITIDATNTGIEKIYNGKSGVGFAEVRIPGQQDHEVLRMPEDLLTASGAASATHRLTIIMTRETASPVPPATDPEIDIARAFTLPTARRFSVSGTAELSTLVPDDVLDRLLGTTVPGIKAAYSSGRLPGDVQDRTSATLDGNLATVWSPGLGPQDGSWLDYDLVHPITFNHLSTAIVTDGKHSVPTAVTVSAGGQSRTVALPALRDLSQPWATQNVTVDFPALTGSNVKVTFDSVRPVTDLDYYADKQVALPIGIAEMDIPGMPRAVKGPARLPAPCRSDLLTIDGKAVPVRITGTTASAALLGTLEIQGCGSAANGISLAAGPHEVQTQPGFPPGVDVDVDSVVLDSAPGGSALAPTPSGRSQPVESGTAPTLTVVHSSATSAKVVVHDPTGPFWMVLGQSTNAGWHATTGAGTDLGPPRVIDGYANGWLVTPSAPGHDMVITLTWTPQRLVWVALAVSALSLVLCVVLGCWPRRRRGRRGAEPVSVPAGPTGAYARTPRVAVSAVGATPPVSTGDDAHDNDDVGNDTGEGDDPSPLLVAPWRSSGTRPGWAAVVAVTVVAGAVSSAVISPEAGLPVALATFLALVVGYGRGLLVAGSVGLLVAVDWLMTNGQATSKWVAEFGWPTHFESASTLAWFAVVALGADGLVQEVRNRRAGRVARRGAPRPEPPPVNAEPAVGRGRRRRGSHVRNS